MWLWRSSASSNSNFCSHSRAKIPSDSGSFPEVIAMAFRNIPSTSKRRCAQFDNVMMLCGSNSSKHFRRFRRYSPGFGYKRFDVGGTDLWRTNQDPKKDYLFSKIFTLLMRSKVLLPRHVARFPSVDAFCTHSSTAFTPEFAAPCTVLSSSGFEIYSVLHIPCLRCCKLTRDPWRLLVLSSKLWSTRLLARSSFDYTASINE